MKQREKTLFFAAVGLVGFTLAYVLLLKMVFNPIADARQRIAQVETDIETRQTEINRGRIHTRKLDQWARHSFGTDETEASEKLRAHILRVLDLARIDTRQFTLSPVTGGTIGGGKEIGWTVRIGGSLDQVTNLLYLLQNDPALHRLEAINWRPLPRSTQVELSFTYRTLVLEKLTASDPASAKSHMLSLLSDLGLSSSEFSRFDPIPGPDGTPSPGWDVTVNGSPQRIEDLVARMERDPYLFKASGVVRNELDDGRLEIRFKLDAPPIDYGRIELAAQTTDKERAPYNLVAQRDLFRPYIRRPPPPPRPTQTADNTPPFNPLSVLRVVGLPTWAGVPKVVVHNTSDNTTQTYEVGEDLANGEIMMVDYRPVPRADKPFLNSPSRVFVRMGTQVYAIELGQTLVQRRLMKVEQLPDSLRKEVEAMTPKAPPATAPAAPPGDAPAPTPPTTEKEEPNEESPAPTQENPDAP